MQSKKLTYTRHNKLDWIGIVPMKLSDNLCS